MVVFVIDEDPAVLDSLRTLLESAARTVRACSSAAEFLNRYQGEPGCMIVDMQMPDMGGLELQQVLKERGIDLPVIFLTGPADLRLGVQAIKQGAINVLEKPFQPGEILDTVAEALQVYSQAEHQPPKADGFRQRLKLLTRGELEVLRGLVLGQSNPMIASELDLSLRTVQFRRTAIWKKLAVNSKRELMDQVFAAGWSPSEIE